MPSNEDHPFGGEDPWIIREATDLERRERLDEARRRRRFTSLLPDEQDNVLAWMADRLIRSMPQRSNDDQEMIRMVALLLRGHGDYKTARLELEKLRLGLTRVAEATGNEDIVEQIPAEHSECGWNRLCAILCDWLDDHPAVRRPRAV